MMRQLVRHIILLTGVLTVAACSSSGHVRQQTYGPSSSVTLASAQISNPKIVKGASRVECVPYARRLSGINLRGDAWTWWRNATDRYARSSRPAVGSIIVLARTDRLRHGHIAVVTKVVNSREILVEHANWLNKGRIHKEQPVLDVSKNNDWSAVRVWYTPGNQLGARTYPVAGFVLKRSRVYQSAALRLN